MAHEKRALIALHHATLTVTSEHSLQQVLETIVGVAQELLSAQYAALGISNDAGRMIVFIHRGFPTEMVQQLPHLPLGKGLLHAIISEQRTIRLADLSQDARAYGVPPGHPEMRSFLGTPLITDGVSVGNLYLTNKIDQAEFSAEDETILEMLAAHAAIAITKAHLYEQVQQLAVHKERTRIGMDLHDGVIQSIYGVGLVLESAQQIAEQPELQPLLDAAINGLSGAIRDLRNFIMDLRPRRLGGNLSDGLARLVREFQANALVPARLNNQLEDETGIPQNMTRAIYLTAQEALANVARHADASQVLVALTTSAESLTLSIQDNGIGFDLNNQNRRVGHGLLNIQERAHAINGDCHISSTIGQGTLITLTLPLETASVATDD